MLVGLDTFSTNTRHQIRPIVEEANKPPEAYCAQITGIEKEDRLAKISKIAAFMYGREQIKILNIDALSADKAIKTESFDILVANPPFAVEGLFANAKR